MVQQTEEAIQAITKPFKRIKANAWLTVGRQRGFVIRSIAVTYCRHAAQRNTELQRKVMGLSRQKELSANALITRVIRLRKWISNLRRPQGYINKFLWHLRTSDIGTFSCPQLRKFLGSFANGFGSRLTVASNQNPVRNRRQNFNPQFLK